MITIDRGNGIELMSETLLEGQFYSLTDTAHEHTLVTEYRLQGKTVHRSVHVTLKEGLGIEAHMGQIGG